jgi:hypothetical protein
VVKLLAVVQVDRNQMADAKRLVTPVLQVKVSDAGCDYAYVMAALDLEDGKKVEAGLLLDKFPPPMLSSFWKPRFQRLRAQLQD